MEAQSGVKNNRADIKIILVEPQMGENIGSTARIMHNFGFKDLRIVSPRDGWPNEKAFALSVNASFILDNAIIFSSLEEALADVNYVYAASARPRFLNKKMLYSSSIIEEDNLFNEDLKIAIIFGAESSGLSNDHLSLCNAIITIPVNEEFKSLNLAQSVGVICYEIFKSYGAKKINLNSQKLADIDDIYRLFTHLESELENRDFFKVLERKNSMINNLRSIFTRINNFTEKDVKTLRGVITCLTTRKNNNCKIKSEE